MKGCSTTLTPWARAWRAINMPLAAASWRLNVAATPMVEVGAIEGTRVRTPGGPSAKRMGGMPSRLMPEI